MFDQILCGLRKSPRAQDFSSLIWNQGLCWELRDIPLTDLWGVGRAETQ